MLISFEAQFNLARTNDGLLALSSEHLLLYNMRSCIGIAVNWQSMGLPQRFGGLVIILSQ